MAYSDHPTAPPGHRFHLPPGFRLLWDAELPVDDVGDGPAVLQGTLEVVCGPAAGSLVSDPIAIVLTASSNEPRPRASPAGVERAPASSEMLRTAERRNGQHLTTATTLTMATTCSSNGRDRAARQDSTSPTLPATRELAYSTHNDVATSATITVQ